MIVTKRIWKTRDTRFWEIRDRQRIWKIRGEKASACPPTSANAKARRQSEREIGKSRQSERVKTESELDRMTEKVTTVSTLAGNGETTPMGQVQLHALMRHETSWWMRALSSTARIGLTVTTLVPYLFCISIQILESWIKFDDNVVSKATEVSTRLLKWHCWWCFRWYCSVYNFLKETEEAQNKGDSLRFSEGVTEVIVIVIGVGITDNRPYHDSTCAKTKGFAFVLGISNLM